MSRAIGVAAFAFAASLGLNWPELPFNARLSEVLFLPLAVLALVEARRDTFRLGLLDVLVLAYLAGALPSLLVSGDLRASSIELARHVYLACTYLVVAVLVAHGHSRPVVFGLVAGGLALATIGIAFAVAGRFGLMPLASIGELMRMPYVGEVLRLRALTMSPAMLGSLLTVAAPIALGAALNSDDRSSRRMWGLAFVIMTIAVMLTFSHTLSGFLVAVVVVAWPALAANRVMRSAAVAGVLLGVLGLNVMLMTPVRSVVFGDVLFADSTQYSQSVGEGRVSLGAMQVEYDVMSYLRVKQLAFEAFAEHPLTGIGLDRFHTVTEQAFQQGRLTHLYRAIDPHSSLFGRFAETGIAGGVTLVALWLGIVAAGVRALRGVGEDRWIALAMIAAITGLLVAAINVDIMNFRFVWVAAGVLRGLERGHDA